MLCNIGYIYRYSLPLYSCMKISINKHDLSAFQFSNELKQTIVDTCEVIQQKKNEVALHQGEKVVRIPLYLSGETILTHYNLESDKKYTICRVGRGETCPTSLSSILTNHVSPVTGVAVQDAMKVIVPVRYVLDWQSIYPTWSKFLIKSITLGYTSVLDKFHQNMSKTVEERIVEFFLQGEFNQIRTIRMTHQQLASEIGTSRVVVSRVLKNLERSGLIELQRGRILLRAVG